MIDTLTKMLSQVRDSKFLSSLDIQHEDHVVITLHRPSNVDSPEQLLLLLEEIKKMSEQFDIIWPIHPRTKSRIEAIGEYEALVQNASIHMTKPLGYIDFMKCIYESRMVVTDSGGIQEETTWLGVPCITLRPNTERPVTITEGTNVLSTPEKLHDEIRKVIAKPRRSEIKIDLWDGKTAERCVESLLEFLS
jgi:UDP-N-acetylglucosamine 2-epimerase (non-hydrolysing)